MQHGTAAILHNPDSYDLRILLLWIADQVCNGGTASVVYQC